MSKALAFQPTTMTLSDSRVLVAEDEFVIAFGLQTDLEELGATVVMVDSVADGMPLSGEPFDAAVLDVRLADGDVYPLADVLYARGVPIVFHSAHADVTSLTRRYPGVVALRKPCWVSSIADAVGHGVRQTLTA